jgi:hypothetical protein
MNSSSNHPTTIGFTRGYLMQWLANIGLRHWHWLGGLLVHMGLLSRYHVKPCYSSKNFILSQHNLLLP